MYYSIYNQQKSLLSHKVSYTLDLYFPPLFTSGRLHLNDVAALIDKSTLARLKKEYGGLQTLLRNHCQVFEGISIIV